MSIEIEVEPRYQPKLDPEVVRQAAEQALHASPSQGIPALTVLVTGDEAIQDLNRKYMGIDAPTDVLSFPSGEPPAAEGEEVYLGDIMISLEQAERQAAAGGHTLAHEVELLTVHGVLHLLGFDHADPDQKSEMWAAQAAALGRLGNPLSPP